MPPMSSAQLKAAMSEYGDGLVRMASKMLKGQEGTEDIVQEAFFKFWQTGQTETIHRPGAWLQRTTANLCRNELEHRAIAKCAEAELDLRPSSLTRELCAQLNTALKMLPQQQREAFTLIGIQGRDSAAAANALRCEAATARKHYQLAREKLRRVRTNFDR